MRLLLLILLPLPALAARPGEDGVMTTVSLQGGIDTDSRDVVGVGADVRIAIPINPERAIVPDFEIRGSLLNTRLPPKNLESFIRTTSEEQGDAIPSDARLHYAHWQSRVSAMASWGATSRELGLRGRIGGLWTMDGDAGAMNRLEPYGWVPDYTASSRLGLTGAAGIGIPIGDEVTDPLLDLRFGASVVAPIFAGGGGVADQEYRDFVLTVDDEIFQATGFVGRESRIWGEGTLRYDRLHIGLEVGLEHTARGAIARARAQSDTWNWVDAPEAADPHATLTVGWIF